MTNELFASSRWRLTHLLLTCWVYFCGAAFLMQFPRYILLLGGDAQDAGWLLALGLIPALLLAAPAGEWNRRHGGRWSALLGCGLVVASSLLMVDMQTIGPSLYGVRMLYAIGHTLMFATMFTQAALLYDSPMERLQVIGWLAVTVQLGNAAGGLIGEWALLAGVQPYWLGCAALGACAGVLGVFFPARREAPATKRYSPSEANGPWPVEVWAVAAIGMAFAGLTQFMPSFIEHLGRSGQALQPFAAAWFITPALLVVAAVRLVGGYFAARLMQPWVLCSCHAMLLLTILLLPWIESRGEAVLLALAFGLSYGWLYPALNGLAFQHASAEARGRLSGWLINAFEIGFRLGTLGLGTLIVYLGYPGMFFGLACLYLALLFRGWRRRRGAVFPRPVEE